MPNIEWCIENGVLSRDETVRAFVKLMSDAKPHALAKEFGEGMASMVEYTLDAGLAFMRVCLATSVEQAPGLVLSPGPVGDAGWDSLADVPEDSDEWRRYVGMCQRMSEVLAVPPIVIRHVALTPEQGVAARDLGAIRNVVTAMDNLGIHYVPEHWPLSASANCWGQGVPPCHAHTELLAAA